VISLLELNSHGYPTTPEIDENLQILLGKLNRVREAYGFPMMVTSGLRSLEKQMEVNPEAPKSHHLTGEAADILDQSGKLKAWVKDNLTLIESIGLWMEDFKYTENWVHFQICPPRSGHRFFIP
jgi:hypothetical protein